MKLITIQSEVSVILGILDEDLGEVVQTIPLQAALSSLSEDAFKQALEQVSLKKKEIEGKIPKEKV